MPTAAPRGPVRPAVAGSAVSEKRGSRPRWVRLGPLSLLPIGRGRDAGELAGRGLAPAPEVGSRGLTLGGERDSLTFGTIDRRARNRGRPDELRRHRRALRILVVVLIPLAIWTVAGLIALWPGNIVQPHQRGRGRLQRRRGHLPHRADHRSQPRSPATACPARPPGVSNTAAPTPGRAARAATTRARRSTVPLTDAVYSSGVEVGQVVTLIRVPPADGQPAQYQFSDFERRTPLIVFAAAVRRRGGRRGPLARLRVAARPGLRRLHPGQVHVPGAGGGSNPIVVGLIGSSAIMFVVLYAAHGFSARTTTALVGTLFGLILIAALGYAATRWAHLTGVSAEDDYVLAAAAPDLRLTSVVLCGIIVAGLGRAQRRHHHPGLGGLGAGRPAVTSQRQPVLPGDADRPGPHRLHRLHHRLRHRRAPRCRCCC